MKSIRNIAFTVLLTLGGFTAVTYTACNKDECKDVVCQNGGSCVEGTCSCAAGYEGTNCETKSSAKFVGTYTVTENCGGDPYPVVVTAVDASTILISNLGNYDCSSGDIVWTATVSKTSLTIADNKCSTQMNGTGSYDNGTVTINYTTTYDGGGDNCKATMVKQN